MVLGGVLPFEDLLTGDAPGPDEGGPGWDGTRASPASAAWPAGCGTALLDHEQMQDR